MALQQGAIIAQGRRGSARPAPTNLQRVQHHLWLLGLALEVLPQRQPRRAGQRRELHGLQVLEQALEGGAPQRALHLRPPAGAAAPRARWSDRGLLLEEHLAAGSLGCWATTPLQPQPAHLSDHSICCPSLSTCSRSALSLSTGDRLMPLHREASRAACSAPGAARHLHVRPLGQPGGCRQRGSHQAGVRQRPLPACPPACLPAHLPLSVAKMENDADSSLLGAAGRRQRCQLMGSWACWPLHAGRSRRPAACWDRPELGPRQRQQCPASACLAFISTM